MGVVLFMRTEKEHQVIERLYCKEHGLNCLSSNFGSLVTGTYISLNDIKKVFNPELSFLSLTNDTGITSALNGFWDYMEFEIEQLQNEEEKEQFRNKAIKEAAAIKQKEELDALHKWTAIEVCKPLIQKFLDKIIVKPESFQQVYHKSHLKQYLVATEEENYTTIVTDLKKLLHFLNFAQKNGAKKFAFYFL